MRPYTREDYNRTRMQNRQSNRILNEAFNILESAKKEVKKNVEDKDNIDEQELNELFGFGKDNAEKPAKALSLENSDEENAELFIQWFAWYLNQANDNIQKGLSTFFNDFSAVLIKAPKMIVKGVIMLLSMSVKGVAYAVKTSAGIVLGSIFALIRLINSGVENAKECLENLYKAMLNGFQQFYKTMCDKANKFIADSQDKLKVWMGALTAAFMAVVNNVTGAAEAFGKFVKQILSDAKDKVDGAVLIAKTWLQSKSEEAKNWIKQQAGDIRNAVVDAWNAMDKKVRNGYNNAVKKLEDWMSSIKELIAYAGTKIAEKGKEAAQKSKEYVVDKKDKAMVWSIQKAVKALSNNYTEDQVVALVRKCYNESLKPMFNGNYRINEAYFYDARTRRALF